MATAVIKIEIIKEIRVTERLAKHLQDTIEKKVEVLFMQASYCIQDEP